MIDLGYALQLVAVAAGTAIVLTALGATPARLLLRDPAGWWLAAPAVGFAVFAVVASWMSLWLPMRVAAWPLLALAFSSALTTVASLARLIRWFPTGSVTVSMAETALVALLSAVALVFALAPAIAKPDLIAIGPNWDLEIYLPLAAALIDNPNGFSFEHSAGLPFPGLPNPLLWRINHFDPRSGGLAFSMLHASVSAVTGLGPHQTYIPTLAALFMLAVPGYRLLFGMVMPGKPATLTTVALAFNAAAAFVVFMGFGQQAAAALLLAPLVYVARRSLALPDRRSLFATALLLAGLLVTYSPVLPLGALMLAGLAVGQVILARAPRPMVSLLLVAMVAAALVPFAIVRLAMRAWYAVGDGGIGGLTVGPGVEQFTPLAWGLGLLPSPGVAQGWTVAVALPWDAPVVSILLTLGVVALAVVGGEVSVKQWDWPLLGALAGCGALLLALRLGVPYPYGFFKLLPSAAPFLILLPALGLSRLTRLRPITLPVPLALAALITTTGIVAAIAAIQSSPHAYVKAAELQRLVKPGERVCVQGGHGLEGPSAGAVAYFLRHADLYGDFKTGYSTFFRPVPDRDGPNHCVWLVSSSTGIGAVPAGVSDGGHQVLGWRLERLYPLSSATRDAPPPVLVEPPRIDQGVGLGRGVSATIMQWRADGSPDIESWTPPLLGVLAPTWGAEWRLPDPGRADDRGVLTITSGGLTDNREVMLNLKGSSGSAETVLDIYREDGAVHYGYWRLGPGPLPNVVVVDLAAQRLTTANGSEPPHETFPAADGRYRAFLVRYLDGAPERTLPLFSFRLAAGVASEFVMETRGELPW